MTSLPTPPRSLAALVASAQLDAELFDLYKRGFSSPGVDAAALLRELDALIAGAGPEAKQSSDRYSRLIRLALRHNGADSFGEQASGKAATVVPAKHRPVVITSLNPFGRIDLQRRCFEKWQALGFDIRTANHHSEFAALRQAGISEALFLDLEDGETGLELHGKPVPRIDAVLRQAIVRFDGDVLIVNSDLYPDVDTGAFVTDWQLRGRPLALVREDQIAMTIDRPGLARPYTSGLDAFLLPRTSLSAIYAELKLLKSARRMCFGIVGWDFVMGALLTRFGGEILESGVLVHEFHVPTYSNVAEFRYHADAMHAMGFAPGRNYTDTAMVFAHFIAEQCAQTRSGRASRRVMPTPTEADLTPVALEVLKEFDADSPEFVHGFGRPIVISLINTADRHRHLSLQDFISNLTGFEEKSTFALHLALYVMRWRLGATRSCNITFDYPHGNKHAAAVEHLRKAYAGMPDIRRNALASLFLIELDEYGIFNKLMFNFLALSCENDAERMFLRKIGDVAGQRIVHAA